MYGTPLTTDSAAGPPKGISTPPRPTRRGNDSILAFADIGLGRTRVDRGNFSGVRPRSTSVPTSYLYDIIQEASYASGGAVSD